MMMMMIIYYTDPALSDQTSHIHCQERRNKVAQWLMEAVAPVVEEEVAATNDTVCYITISSHTNCHSLARSCGFKSHMRQFIFL